jgi:hypothetical protein
MSKTKWWLAIIVVCCLAPTSFAGHERDRDHGHGCDHNKKDCQQVPEGGSTAIYLLGAGLTCFGAMFLRSRLAKPAQL